MTHEDIDNCQLTQSVYAFEDVYTGVPRIPDLTDSYLTWNSPYVHMGMRFLATPLKWITFAAIVQNSDVTPKKNNHVKTSNNPKCLLVMKKNKKISRNDRCEATGKKFKNCCGTLQ